MEMSKSDEAFLAAIDSRWAGYVLAVGCRGVQCEYAEGDEDHQCESSFSWRECDSCGSHLGGDRGKAQAFEPAQDKPDITEIDICTDCRMWHANGELPENWGS
jgi:hypothetical protein